MSIFEHPDFDNHESVHAFTDPASGLRGFVGIHSTARGPSAGGVRFWSYEVPGDALTDVLRLSRGMSYKNAIAGLNLGGGKAVVMKPEGDYDRDALFTNFGKCIESLGGRYYTAEDVGMSPADMSVIRKQTKFVAGLTEGEAASGDPSPVTADGVFRCIRLAADKKLRRDLKGVRIAVQGLGHVGYDVCRRLHDVGAELIVTDINQAVLKQAKAEFGARVVGLDGIYGVDADIYAPCALGATINPNTINHFKFKAIAGAANNQLSVPQMGQDLQERSILYCPDYVVNGGGIINIAGEIEGHYSPKWVEEKLVGLEKTLAEIIEKSGKTGRTTDVIADEMARARIAEGANAA